MQRAESTLFNELLCSEPSLTTALGAGDGTEAVRRPPPPPRVPQMKRSDGDADALKARIAKRLDCDGVRRARGHLRDCVTLPVTSISSHRTLWIASDRRNAREAPSAAGDTTRAARLSRFAREQRLEFCWTRTCRPDSGLRWARPRRYSLFPGTF